ncbi:1320_t:CDS:2 [Funneliformis caledonium]|uniref:SWR1-complex protein 5 n=1 Tax=Funneliformis caledonium TaxID=1117310 RepID=A0A9N9BMF2_9GLOM|nr:1320_t:CDS:2 [Funneliformis caledonium]
MSANELQEDYSSDSSNDPDYVLNDSEDETELVNVAAQGKKDLDDETNLMTRSKRKKIEAETETYNNIKKQKFEEKIAKESNTIDEERKSKIDALWAELNADDEDYLPIPAKPYNNLVDNKALLNDNPVENKKSKFPLTNLTKVPKSTKMITITKTYKFAGDIITEHKQVPEDSEEGQAFLEEQETSETSNESSSIFSTSRTSVKSPSTIPKSGSGGGNVDKFIKSKISIEQLASLKKKPTKLNTLEKSKMDWKKYVEQEQIVDELKYHNKNGI